MQKSINSLFFLFVSKNDKKELVMYNDEATKNGGAINFNTPDLTLTTMGIYLYFAMNFLAL